MDSKIRLQIEQRQPFADNKSFGDVGPYEVVSGRVDFEIDPDDSANSAIVDLHNAPRTSTGLVNYSADLYILKPSEMARGNRRLIYDVNNRGDKRIVHFFNDAVDSNAPITQEHAGNGYLMRRGYTIVWSGWQGDIVPGNQRLILNAPVATNNGREITGPVRMEFTAEEDGTFAIPLSGNEYTSSYETAYLDTHSAKFTFREYENDSRQQILSDQWQFANVDENGQLVLSSTHCYLSGGFKPGLIYELVYTAKNPMVMGLGFAGARDLVSFLIHCDVDDFGTKNPLVQGGIGIQKAYAWGRSQSGRFLREFIYLGFNVDPQGRSVFDAISPHVSGGGRVILNYRFAQPGRYPRQHSDHLYPSDQFPFAYHVLYDPLTGRRDGILKRPDTDPIVIHTQTSSEYWERRGSLVHTDSNGNDLPEHSKARVYLFSSSQHSADPLKGPQIGPHLHPSNPLNTTPLLRALLDVLDDWATHGTVPPPSMIPKCADGSLAGALSICCRFPSIPGVKCPTAPSRLFVQDHGSNFQFGVMSVEPPTEHKDREYTVLVPQIDSDGNEIPGIRTPHLEVPLATFTGWNFRSPGNAGNSLSGVLGSHLPFSATKDVKDKMRDSRKSLDERYPSKEQYVEAINAAARRLVDKHLLLDEDLERYVECARDEVLGPGTLDRNISL